SAPTSETAGTLNIVSGANTVRTSATGSGSTAAITFAGISRTSGVVNFETASGVDINLTNTPTPVNGLLCAYATPNGDSSASLTGSTIGQFSSVAGETDTDPVPWTSTQNINLTNGATSTVTAATNINSLRIASGNVTVNGGAGLTLGSGGILAPGTTNPNIN